MSMDNFSAKLSTRKHYREICKKITPLYRQEAAIAAAKILFGMPIFKNNEHIACYLSTQNEFDTAPIIETIWQAKKKCYLPIVNSEKDEKELQFERYEYGDALHLNRYSILEPVKKTDKMAASELDIVIVPLIAFDCAGHRLGTGGGFYDATFAFKKEENSSKPLLIGLGYVAQEVSALAFDPWDIVLQGVLTEKKFIQTPS